MSGDVEGPLIDLVVVDGGASRCRLAAFDHHGRRVADAEVDAHASLTLGEAEAWGTIRTGIECLARTLAGASAVGNPASWMPSTLGLGLAGSLQEAHRARFLERVERETGGAVRCCLVTDGHAQLVGASHGHPGICLAIGTGSVAHWLDEGGAYGMAGGWGFPIGDEGSGAWLGARLLQRYLWHRDGWRSESPLMGALDARVGASVSALQRVTTDARSSTHARFARLVVEAAESGDALAATLLDDGARFCARLIERAPSGLPVHVVGGLAPAYATRLAARFGPRLSPPRGDALDGLYLIARGATT